MRLYWILLVLIGTLGLALLLSQKNPVVTKSLAKSFSSDFAYDNRLFLNSVSHKFPENIMVPQVIILPHHLLASTLIAQGISLLVSNPPRTIILLSPNHANSGQCDIVTSGNSWHTPFGEVVVDEVLQQDFLNTQAICQDDSAMEVEHGIAGLIPFIKYYLPNTKIVPFILKKDPNPRMFNEFTQKLISISTSTPVLTSIDFSHGLSHEEALQHDSVTEYLISIFDYPAIQQLSSEYLDSPASLIASLRIIESTRSGLNIIDHTDSSNFNSSPREVTSYYLISGGQISTPSLTPLPTLVTSNSRDNFTLVFAGDVMLGRSVNTRILKYKDFSWPFRKISTMLSEADLTLVNLESPFRSGCKPTDQGMIFCADPRSVDGLKTAGIDIVNLANNHINNQGSEGLSETVRILNETNISFVGVMRDSPESSSVVHTVKNTKISFLGFTDISSYSQDIFSASPENIRTQISEARKNSDLVIATFHWGNEYSLRSIRQQDLAHLAIDSGADVIIGHHPHWVQEVEMYKGKPIYYSLGNLVFDQMWSEKTRNGLVVRLTYSGTTLVSQEEFPIKIFDYGQPLFTD